MTSRISNALSQCTQKKYSESVEVISTDSDLDPNDDTPQEPTAPLKADEPVQGGFLWRMSSGAVSGVYNAATGAAGMGYNTTKWIVGKGVEVGSNVAGKSVSVSGSVLSKTAEVGSNILHKLPVPALSKAKDKKE